LMRSPFGAPLQLNNFCSITKCRDEFSEVQNFNRRAFVL
jgi:hypothetical protein